MHPTWLQPPPQPKTVTVTGVLWPRRSVSRSQQWKQSLSSTLSGPSRSQKKSRTSWTRSTSRQQRRGECHCVSFIPSYGVEWRCWLLFFVEGFQRKYKWTSFVGENWRATFKPVQCCPKVSFVQYVKLKVSNCELTCCCWGGALGWQHWRTESIRWTDWSS